MKSENKILIDIKKYGWHIIHVLADQDGSEYSYTIGLNESYNHPEIAISGLKKSVSTLIIQDIVNSIKNEKEFKQDLPYEDILEGYDCIFKEVRCDFTIRA